MAYAVSSRAVRWASISEGAPLSSADDNAIRTVAQNVARCHRAAAISALQARTQAARAQAEEKHARIENHLSIGTGCVGVSCITTTLIPELIPHQFATAASLIGMLLVVLPVAALIGRSMHWNRAKKANTCSALSMKSAALSKFSTDLGQMFVDMGDKPDMASFRAACNLLEMLENDVAALRQDQTNRAGSVSSMRRHKRIVPHQRRVIIKTSDSRNLVGTIANLSVSGVALSERLPRLEIGDKVMIGQHQAIVTRQSERSTVLQFEPSLDASTFGINTVL